jgi:para-aminobenzoate synthetase component 2
MDVIRECGQDIPIFGVCLGHQALGAAYGATVARAPELLHGKTSLVRHDSTGVLTGLPSPFTATRYHSLAVIEGTLPDEIEVTGRTETGVVMAMRHRALPLEGVQFHPESVLTQGGAALAAILSRCPLSRRARPEGCLAVASWVCLCRSASSTGPRRSSLSPS